MLAELSDRTEVADGVARTATITTQGTETTEVATHDRLRVTNTSRQDVLPKSEYERKSVSRVPRADRWQEAPDEFETETVEYITDTTPSDCSRCRGSGRKPCPTCDGSTVEPCSECGGSGDSECGGCNGTGTNTCLTCSGSGSITRAKMRQCQRCEGSGSIECPDCLGASDDCSNCDGESPVSCPDCDTTGVVERDVSETCPDCDGSRTTVCGSCGGDKTTRCGACSGDGEVTCQGCEGDGDVECDRCDGEGRAASVTLGALSFERTTQIDVDPESVPGAAFRRGDGTETSTTRPVDADIPGGSTFSAHLYRHEVSRARAGCEFAFYTYDSERYWVARVDGELRFDDFPNDPKHLAESIASAKRNGVFGFRSRVGTGTALATSARRLLTDLAKFIGAVIVLAVVFAVAAIVASIGGLFGQTVQSALFYGIGTVASLGVAAVVFTVFWDDRDTAGGLQSQNAYSRWDLLLPAGGCLLAGGAFAASIGTELVRWQASMLALGLWAGRVGTWLDYEGNRLAYVANQRDALLSRLTVNDATLAKHGLRNELPPAAWTLGPTFFRRAGLLVFVVGWGGTAAVLCLLLAAGVVSVDINVVTGWVQPYSAGLLALTGVGLATMLVPRIVD
ncbi:hypothetical protein GCM10008995_19270 [Halobellus salinus]|uniref:CR-type domain-containing protein n=1 Tax=Halobellus salinus TaxID=931585 RepID=A0A830EBF1_9EURY|nr:hypothetical protein GCM10008995_19270 [Halobellus salinus]